MNEGILYEGVVCNGFVLSVITIVRFDGVIYSLSL